MKLRHLRRMAVLLLAAVFGSGCLVSHLHNAFDMKTPTGFLAYLTLTPDSASSSGGSGSVGTDQWARTATAGISTSVFYSVTVDVSENVYAAGSIGGTGTYAFGPGVVAAGASAASNVVLLKYR